METLNNLKDILHYLNLHHTAETYEEYLKKTSQENLSYGDFLQQILSQEASIKQERSMKARLAQAKLPVFKTIDTFDWTHPTTINKQQVLSSFNLDFINRKENIIFLGPSGIGKTHLALALAYKACCSGFKTLWTTAVDMINHLHASQADNSLIKCLKVYTSPKLLVCDELGYLPIDKKGADLFFQVVSSRYEQGSLILTSNRAFKDWGKIFPDNTVATAVIDRLVHHSVVIKIEGASYRIKDRKTKTALEQIKKEKN